jgi:nitroreductase
MSGDGAPDHDPRQALARAADAARFAPSIHNTQPWRWVAHPGRLDLFAVTDRQLHAQDPDGHMLLVSCGTALHHARIALDAEGWRYEVDRPATTPLATIRPTGRGPADPAATLHAKTLQVRHTDRRTVADEPVAPAVLDQLGAATEQAGARLHLLGRDQVIDLAVAVEHAARAQGSDDRVHAETARWTGGDRPAGTGIPDTAIPGEIPLTTVAERDFGTAGTLAAGAGHDGGATYALLYGGGDEPTDWLAAGEALSALWLAATEHGVNLLPLSSPAEVPATRHELQRILGGTGNPFLAVRLGTPDPTRPAPPGTPRLTTDQVIELAD